MSLITTGRGTCYKAGMSRKAYTHIMQALYYTQYTLWNSTESSSGRNQSARGGPGHSWAVLWAATRVRRKVSLLSSSADAPRAFSHYGAEVIKVEPPNVGDPLRVWRERDLDGVSPWWRSIARNKKSVTIDMRQEEGRR